ncbi:MAG: GNAT family N-acetyltransferase [Acidimicrobiales bacterium]
MIRQVTAEATYPLRQQVLRPHQRVDEVGFPGENDPGTAHFAAFDGGGRIVGIATALHQGPDGAIPAADPATAADLAGCWRLRGMAVDDDQRHLGIGAALLERVVDHVARHGATALWCNARLSAAGFYRAAGLAPCGDSWEEPGIGPHVKMWRPISAPEPNPAPSPSP